MSDKENYENLIKKQILSFDLHKNQSYVDRLMKEGEIKGLLKLQKFYRNTIEAKYLIKQEKLKSFKSIEASMKKFDIEKDGPKVAKEIYFAYKQLLVVIHRLRDELCILKATEKIFADLDRDVENTLTSLDILSELKEVREVKKYSPDVQIRVDNNLCALKRPGGKKKFVCNNEIVPGTKYCKEHLKKYEPIIYTDIFPEGE